MHCGASLSLSLSLAKSKGQQGRELTRKRQADGRWSFRARQSDFADAA